ncbi:MAG: transposase [Bacteroidetes bacterium]|nr:transposase [Bacteroidota bacterium]MDA1119690.1 transposase [Bacteroidota bacterium]
MSEVYKTHEGGLFFVTFSVVGWLDVFIRTEYQNILIDNLIFCQKQKGLLLYEYCVMPSHVHMIAARTHGKLSDVLRDFKSYTAKKLIECIKTNLYESRREFLLKEFRKFGALSSQKQDNQFWQHENHAFSLESNKMIDQEIKYIHQNPVVAGFVDESWKWRLSSANLSSPVKVLEL